MIKTFLKDVFICSLSAFGGPEAHYGVFTKQLVEKKGYLTADELLEWMALTSLLPGPSSTQTITAIGYQKGGVKLAFLTLMVWALPIVILMTGLTFFISELAEVEAVIQSVAALGFMAIGFLVFGAYKISKKALVSKITLALFLVSFSISLFVRSFYIFPLLIIGSGVIHAMLKPSTSKERTLLKWNIPLLIGILFLLGWGLLHPLLETVPFLQLSSVFTGFGSLVLGGGNVVIPYMYETLVEGYGWISSDDFLAGLGLIQGMPGPMFSFSAWVAGLSFQENPVIQISAGLTGAFFLFLPGTLFIFLVAPVWNQLRLSPRIKPALSGVLAGAAGLVVSTAILIVISTELSFNSILLMGITLVLLFLKKIPVPIILVIILGLGILL